MLQLIKISSILIYLISYIPSVASQEVNRSNIVTGKNGQITYNINIANPGKSDELYLITTSLGSYLQTTSTESANLAYATGRFALAADIWGKIAEDAKNIRRSSKESAQALARKAEAESLFDKAKASGSINSAIRLDPENIALIERAAIIEISRHDLEGAKSHLLSMITQLTKHGISAPAETLYLTYCRMFGINAVQGNDIESAEFVKKAARVFNDKLSKPLQKKFSELQYSLYANAIDVASKQIKPDAEIGALFSQTLNLLDSGGKFSHISTGSGQYWYSLKSGSFELMEDIDLSEKVQIPALKSNTEYILTDHQYRINQVLLRMREDAKSINDPSSNSSRRKFQELHNELLLLSESCRDCPQYAKSKHLASFILGNYFSLIGDQVNAYTHYSMALSEIKRVIDAGPGDPADKLMEIRILIAIGDIRNSELISTGDLMSSSARTEPYSIAYSRLKNLRIVKPNNAQLISIAMEVSSKLRRSYIQASNLDSAKSICEGTLDDFTTLRTNPIYTKESFDNFLNCQFSLLSIDKIFGRTTDLMTRRESVIRAARESNMLEADKDIGWLPKIEN